MLLKRAHLTGETVVSSPRFTSTLGPVTVETGPEAEPTQGTWAVKINELRWRRQRAEGVTGAILHLNKGNEEILPLLRPLSHSRSRVIKLPR